MKFKKNLQFDAATKNYILRKRTTIAVRTSYYILCRRNKSLVHAKQTSPGSGQVFENLGLAHASVDAKNLGSA